MVIKLERRKMSKIIKKENKIIKPKLTDIEFKNEFTKRLDDFKKWGEENGYKIDAFLHIDIKGIITDIGYIKIK